MLRAVSPLASTLRYGDVRQTDTSAIARVVWALAERSIVGLAPACIGLDDEAAQAFARDLAAASRALASLENASLLADWWAALGRLVEREGVPGLVAGTCSRLLLSAERTTHEQVADRLARALARGAEPAVAAGWLEGFLSSSGLVLATSSRLFRHRRRLARRLARRVLCETSCPCCGERPRPSRRASDVRSPSACAMARLLRRSGPTSSTSNGPRWSNRSCAACSGWTRDRGRAEPKVAAGARRACRGHVADARWRRRRARPGARGGVRRRAHRRPGRLGAERRALAGRYPDLLSDARRAGHAAGRARTPGPHALVAGARAAGSRRARHPPGRHAGLAVGRDSGPHARDSPHGGAPGGPGHRASPGRAAAAIGDAARSTARCATRARGCARSTGIAPCAPT